MKNRIALDHFGTDLNQDGTSTELYIERGEYEKGRYDFDLFNIEYDFNHVIDKAINWNNIPQGHVCALLRKLANDIEEEVKNELEIKAHEKDYLCDSLTCGSGSRQDYCDKKCSYDELTDEGIEIRCDCLDTQWKCPDYTTEEKWEPCNFT